MTRAIGYAGPVVLAAGAWLAAPRPHAWLSQELLLGLVGAVLVIGLVGVALGRQLVVAGAVGAAIAPTVPTIVPMAWTGALAIVLGAAVGLEGARANREGLPLPPLRAWALPVGLLAFSLLVVLVALTTTVGRESLDITQGMGVAVSVPFLLLGAWAGLAALERRSDEDASGAWTVLVAALALAGGAMMVATDPASAQANACEDPRSATGFEACPTASHVHAQQDVATNVTHTSWELSGDETLFIHPGFQQGDVSNVTFLDATLTVEIQSQPLSGCADATLVVQRATGPWSDETNLTQAPDGADPVTVSPSDQACSLGGSVPVDVSPHFEAWSQGHPLEGWRIHLANEGSLQGAQGPYAMNATYAVNGPTIERVTTAPEPRGGTTMAPVDEAFTVTLNVTDPIGNLKNATLTVDEDPAYEAPLSSTGEIPLSFTVTEATADGTLEATVWDWDGNRATSTITQVRPDREAPELSPGPLVTATEDGFTLEDPLPEDDETQVTFNVSDDACPLVDPCTSIELIDEDGQLVQNVTTNQTHPNATFTLPTEPTGERALILNAKDAADRSNATLLTYAVSEPRAPTLHEVTLTDMQGRQDRQEAGLPLNVTVHATDESPPLTATVTDAGTTLATGTLNETNGTLKLAPTLETAGTRTLTVTVEDRWGNQAQQARPVEVHPQRAPTITLPTPEHVPAQARLTASIQDASLSPENATVTVIRGGTQLEAVTVDKHLTEDGLDAEIHLPDLLHGEPIRVSITATDALGQFATGTSDHTVDALAPEITVEPEPGATLDGDVWTLPNATLLVAAEDEASGLEALHLVEPHHQSLDATGHALPMSEIGQEAIRVEAQDAVGNTANWTGQLRMDHEAPQLDLDVDGHALIVTVHEEESGIRTLDVDADGADLSPPNVPGEHRIHVPNVTRGDTVSVGIAAQDRVGHEATLERTVTIQDAPPEVRIGSLEEQNVTLSTSDPDGDPVSTAAELVHAVNETTWSFPDDASTLTLPAWRGDVHLTVTATAHETTLTENRTFTLGQAPHVHATPPGEIEPGAPTTVDVEWERDYDSITLVALDGDRQVDLANVTQTGPGNGQAEIQLPEGTYELELRAQHADGTVQTASAGTVSVEEGPSTMFLAIGLLLLVALVGVIVLNRFRDEGEPPPEGTRT